MQPSGKDMNKFYQTHNKKTKLILSPSSGLLLELHFDPGMKLM